MSHKIESGKLSFEVTDKKRSLYRRNNNIVAADNVSDAEKRRLALRALATNQLLAPEVAGKVSSYLTLKEIIRYMCATTADRRQKLCLNARFWRFWINELRVMQLEKKLDDAGLYDNKPFREEKYPKVVFHICKLMLESVDLMPMYALFNRFYSGIPNLKFSLFGDFEVKYVLDNRKGGDTRESIIYEFIYNNTYIFENLFLFQCTVPQLKLVLQHAQKNTLKQIYIRLILNLLLHQNEKYAQLVVEFCKFMNSRGLKFKELMHLLKPPTSGDMFDRGRVILAAYNLDEEVSDILAKTAGQGAVSQLKTFYSV